MVGTGNENEAEVYFAIQAETSFGDSIRVVGSADALGGWQPERGLELKTDATSYPCWSHKLCIPASALQVGDLEYKFVILKADGRADWEPGGNRIICAKHFDFREPAEIGLAPVFGDTNRDGATGIRREVSTVSTCYLTQIDLEEEASTCCLNLESFSDKASEDAGDDDVTLARTASVLPSIPSSTNTWLWAGAHRLSKPGGPCEDAYFFAEHAMGVADGVGQMADYESYGIDTPAYAAELMEHAARALMSECSGINIDEEDAIQSHVAAALTAAEANATSYGASTISVMTVESNTVGVANLGDSGFMLLRRKPWGMEIVQRTVEQDHSWNCPYQLTHVPDSLAQTVNHLDSAADCQRYSMEVEVGDLLLMFTDGFTDNLFWYDVVRIVDEVVGSFANGSTELLTPPEAIAEALAVGAQQRSLDSDAQTPFSKKARLHRIDCRGGKTDDITVVAGWVMPENADVSVSRTDGVTVSCPRSVASSRLLLP